MGWTSIPTSYLRNKQSSGIKEYLIKEYSNEKYRAVDYSRKGKTVYMAFESTDTKEVFAVVIMISFEKGEFFYKEIHEASGPLQIECPQRILKKLTPTYDKYAQEWRKKCWDYHRIGNSQGKLYKHGAIIEFQNEFNFNNGLHANKFVLLKTNGKTTFAIYRGEKSLASVYPMVKITSWKKYEHKVIGQLT